MSQFKLILFPILHMLVAYVSDSHECEFSKTEVGTINQADDQSNIQKECLCDAGDRRIYNLCEKAINKYKLGHINGAPGSCQRYDLDKGTPLQKVIIASRCPTTRKDFFLEDTSDLEKITVYKERDPPQNPVRRFADWMVYENWRSRR